MALRLGEQNAAIHANKHNDAITLLKADIALIGAVEPLKKTVRSLLEALKGRAT